MKMMMRWIGGPETNFRCRIWTTLRTCRALAVGLGVLLAGLPLLWAGPTDPPPPVPVFSPANFGPAPYVITNPFLPLVPGTTKIFEGDITEGLERTVWTVSEARRVVLGIECRVVVNRAYLDGEWNAETILWFAQDLAGNVWFFGEEGREIENGMVVGTEGWEAGVNGAQPGYAMLAAPRVGDRYRIEYVAGQAEDIAEVTGIGVSVTLRNGRTYTNALRTLEWTPLEPGALENKYYVPGLGQVRAEQADGREPIDFVGSALPLKEAKLIVEHNATDADTGFQVAVDSEGWQRLDLTGPGGEALFTIEGLNELGQLGLTELFFETVAPEHVEAPLETILARLAEGSYLIGGPTIELGQSAGPTSGQPLFTHDIPEGPELLTPAPDATVDSSQPVVMSWEAVTETIDEEPVEIIAYQLIIEKVGAAHPHMIGKRGSFEAYVPATVTSVTLPAGFLQPDADYRWEVLAIEESGNQTVSSGEFDTGDGPAFAAAPAAAPISRLRGAKLNIEHNATDHDTGFQGFVDGEGWQSLTFTSPNGTPVLRIQGRGELGQLGLTELFFETVEPANADVPIADMLAKLPAGLYTISGPAIENGEPEGTVTGTALLTHTIPAGPELLTPSENAFVSAEDLVMSWNPVTTTITGGPVTIIAYQLIIQEVQTPHPHRIGKMGLSTYLPPTVTSVVVPNELLSPATAYVWEVLAIEESGNQTLSSSRFVTEVGDALPLKEAKLIIEHNATAEDTGFQGFIDSEGWQRLNLIGPEGQALLTIEGLGELGQLGLTELFFETVEPANADVPIATILGKLPAGDYLISGPTMELGESSGVTAGTPLLTHAIPRGAVLLTPEEEETVDAEEDVVMSWAPVTQTLDGRPVEIITYQLIIEKVGLPHPHMIGKLGSFNAYLPATVTRVELPEGFLEPDADYAWEVLAIEASGNQTLSSGTFDTGDAPDLPETPANDPPRLKEAKLNIEHNATDHDTGFQGAVDSEGWQSLTFTSPNGTPVLRIQGQGELGQLGLTELFFETVEPANADVPIAEMLAKLPAGEYFISGPSMQNGEPGGLTSGKAWLTHTIPAGPALLTPAENAIVAPEDLMMSWSPVTTTITGGPVTLIAYQLIVQDVQTPHPHRIGKLGLSMYLPPTVTSVIVPDELLAPGRAYVWEVLAIEESGNQTLSSGAFTTRPLLTLTLSADGLLSFPSIPGHHYTIEICPQLGACVEWTALHRLVATGSLTTHDLSAHMAAGRQAFIRVQDTTP